MLPMPAEVDTFRMMMLELRRTTAGCASDAWPGANLCHTSCFREMARGDIELLYAARDAAGDVVSLAVPGEGRKCVRARG